MNKVLIYLFCASLCPVWGQSFDFDVSLPALAIPSLANLEVRAQYNQPVWELPGDFQVWAQPQLTLTGFGLVHVDGGARLLVDGPLFSGYLACLELNSSPSCRVGLKFGIR